MDSTTVTYVASMIGRAGGSLVSVDMTSRRRCRRRATEESKHRFNFG